MKTIWKLFVGDIRRITSNVVSIIIVIGLVVIPGIFTWFNVAASWDPFANTGNLKFAVANEDDGYRSDLIPVKINIGDQVVNTLRSNDQLDWTFTTKKEAINGTKSGKYYAAVVIPKNFSTRMMTFFASDGDHAEIAYYNNEKKNALAPKITGQGADTVSAQVNETFSETLTSTALSVASQLANQLDKPAAQEQLTQFNGNISDFAETLTDASGTLRTFSTLTQSARHLLESSDGLIANVSGNAKSVGTTLKQAGSGVEDLRYEPLRFPRDEAFYLQCYRDAWRNVHETDEGFVPELYARSAARHAQEHPGSVVRVLSGDRVVGLVELDPGRDEQSGCGWISLLYMLPEYRGRGWAIQLLGYAFWFYENHDRAAVRLHVSENNARAITFYQRSGFVQIGRDPGVRAHLLLMGRLIHRTVTHGTV